MKKKEKKQQNKIEEKNNKIKSNKTKIAVKKRKRRKRDKSIKNIKTISRIITIIVLIILATNIIVFTLLEYSFNKRNLEKTIKETTKNIEEKKTEEKIISFKINFNKELLEYVKNKKRNNIKNKNTSNKNEDKILYEKNSYLNLMTEKEKQHIIDVKKVYQKTKNIIIKSTIYSSILLLILLIFKFTNIKKIFLMFFKIQIIILILLLIIISINILLIKTNIYDFNKIFTIIHKPFFKNNFSFSQNSILKTVYPNSLFEKTIIQETILLFLWLIIDILTYYIFCFHLKCISKTSSSSKT